MLGILSCKNSKGKALEFVPLQDTMMHIVALTSCSASGSASGQLFFMYIEPEAWRHGSRV